jgi:cyclic beta-1,2-glucan synthetase
VPKLAMENGLGGFTPDGREYVIVLEGERDTPLPVVERAGQRQLRDDRQQRRVGFTWAGNSREKPLTPFANDPLTDPTGEAMFIRDEDDGAVWGATPSPLPRRLDGGRWLIRHGAGVTRYQHAVDGSHSGAGGVRGARTR